MNKGDIHTRLYKILHKIKFRCYNPKYPQYHYYGGRGIKMCQEWLDSFDAFKEWALSNGYDESLSIDRIDVNGDYEPGNCRWATAKQQSRNKRNNIMIFHDGETKCLAEWCEKYNLNYPTILKRIRQHGWDKEKAITTPIRQKRAR